MNASQACRVCGSASTRAMGAVEYFAGYSWIVYDCDACRCRFTQHDGDVYELLHSVNGIPHYSQYRGLAHEARSLFERRDIAGLKRFLSASTKYRFVLNELEHLGPDARVLEVGCSRGYLTSYFILAGLRVLGVDASADAVQSARESFGDHFATADSDAIEANAPYDVIYHVGTIGCIADPVRFTRRLLALLKPRGRLLFNAPNRDACVMRDQLWFDSAPPPDLVTLYPPGFWKRQFATVADVREGIEFLDAQRSFGLAMSGRLRSWRAPRPRSLQSTADASERSTERSDRFWLWFERRTALAGRSLGLTQFAAPRPSEFGLFVMMRPKARSA